MHGETDFSFELKFTETYKQHLHDPIAIREARSACRPSSPPP